MDFLRQDREHDLMVERSEAVGDVAFDEPGCPGPGIRHLRQRGVASPAGTETVRPAGELGLVVRLQQEAHHLADQFIRPGRQAERPFLPVLLRDVDPLDGLEPVALVAQRIDDAPDLRPATCRPRFPRRPRASSRRGWRRCARRPAGYSCGLNSCRYSLSHGRPRLPRVTQDVHHRFGVLHYAYLRSLTSDHLAPFALRTAFPPSLAGRYSRDYYGACVTIGLAPLR